MPLMGRLHSRDRCDELLDEQALCPPACKARRFSFHMVHPDVGFIVSVMAIQVPLVVALQFVVKNDPRNSTAIALDPSGFFPVGPIDLRTQPKVSALSHYKFLHERAVPVCRRSGRASAWVGPIERTPPALSYHTGRVI
jgi:hypothetical protein